MPRLFAVLTLLAAGGGPALRATQTPDSTRIFRSTHIDSTRIYYTRVVFQPPRWTPSPIALVLGHRLQREPARPGSAVRPVRALVLVHVAMAGTAGRSPRASSRTPRAGWSPQIAASARDGADTRALSRGLRPCARDDGREVRPREVEDAHRDPTTRRRSEPRWRRPWPMDGDRQQRSSTSQSTVHGAACRRSRCSMAWRSTHAGTSRRCPMGDADAGRAAQVAGLGALRGRRLRARISTSGGPGRSRPGSRECRAQDQSDGVALAFSMNTLAGGVQDRDGVWSCDGPGQAGLSLPVPVVPGARRLGARVGHALAGAGGCSLVMWRSTAAYMARADNRRRSATWRRRWRRCRGGGARGIADGRC